MEIKDILKNRREAYEIGSTPEREDRIASLREEIIPILDAHGIVGENNVPNVIEGEGQEVEDEYTQKVSEMRAEIRSLASQRSDKVSQRGEDVLPTLRRLEEFANSEEGQKDGALKDEIAKLIESNKTELGKIQQLQKDQSRVQELKSEIEQIQSELAMINEEVNKNSRYDAESIKRTELNVKLYNRQNELRGILMRNPEASKENSDLTRQAEMYSNILAELENVQKENDKSLDKEEQGKSEETQDKKEEAEKEKIDEEKSTETEKPLETEDEEKNVGIKKEDNEKNTQPVYTVGKIRGALLNFIKKLLEKVKPNGIPNKILSGMESALLVGAKQSLPKESTPTITKTAEKEASQEKVSRSVPTLEDSQWAMEQLRNSKNLDENSLMYKVIKSARKQVGNIRDELNPKNIDIATYNKQNNIPTVEIDKNNSGEVLYKDTNDLVCYKIAETILKQSEAKGISLEGEEGKTRTIDEIYKDLEKKYLQVKTNEVARKTQENKDRSETPTRESSTQSQDEQR